MYFNINFTNNYVCSVLNNEKELEEEVSKMNWEQVITWIQIKNGLDEKGKTHFVTKTKQRYVLLLHL